MKPDPRFLKQPKHFWANVRTISQQIGYTQRGTGQIKIPSLPDIVAAYLESDSRKDTSRPRNDKPTAFGTVLLDYFRYRAETLNSTVEPQLMDAAEAKKLFNELRAKLKPACPIPMNKQSGKKKTPAYLTGIINMLVEANAGGIPCDFDPRELTTVTLDGAPLRTLARRVDGAFP
jgi:hypothetical protein